LPSAWYLIKRTGIEEKARGTGNRQESRREQEMEEGWLQCSDAAGERLRVSRDAAYLLSCLLLYLLKIG